MKYLLSSLFLFNIVVSSVSIISSVLAIYNNVVYSTNNASIFYLCIGLLSFILDLFYLVIKHVPYLELHFDKCIINNFTCLFAFILTIIWMVSSICVAIINKECIHYNGNETCINYTINTTCGFILMFVWFLTIWITLKRLSKLYKKYPALEAQACDESYRRTLTI